MSSAADILYCTDTHLSDASMSVCLDIEKQLLQLKDTRVGGHTAFVHGGDVFHSRKAQSYSTLTCFGKQLERLYSCFGKEKVFLLAGNHDKQDTGLYGSWLDLFVDRGYETYPFHEGSKLQYTFLDFYDSVEYDRRLCRLRKILNSDIKRTVLFTHIGVDGMCAGESSESTKKAFSGFHKVIIGHYHNHCEKDNIYYAGSAYQANFGEDDNKGFLALRDNNGVLEIERIPSTYKKHITYRCNEFDLKEFNKKYDKEEHAVYRVICNAYPSEEDVLYLKEEGIILQHERNDAIIEDVVENDFSYNGYMDSFKKFLSKHGSKEKAFNNELIEDFSHKLKAIGDVGYS